MGRWRRQGLRRRSVDAKLARLILAGPRHGSQDGPGIVVPS
jgi:hypothetical protein